MFYRSFCLAIFLIVLAVGFCATSQASLLYTLSDHPDGDQNPPPYGLRLDNFEGHGSGVYSWQFEMPDAFGGQWQQAVLEVGDDGTIHIYGHMFGGKTTGSVYDPMKSGLVYIDYHYRNHVTIDAGNVHVSVQNDSGTDVSDSNGGTLTGLASWFAGGNTVSFFDKALDMITNTSFVFDNDGHRLAGFDLDTDTTYVGRGWHMFNDNTTGTRDFLFTATALTQPVPEPSTMLIWTVFGLACTSFGLRRRVNC